MKHPFTRPKPRTGNSTPAKHAGEGHPRVIRVLPAPLTLESLLKNWPLHDQLEEFQWDSPRGNELW